MKKLKLNHDELKVESFSTREGADGEGTVLGRQGSSHAYTCYNQFCYTGLTVTCGTEYATDCPGWSECPGYTQDRGNTCVSTCTDVNACTACGAVC